MRAALMILLLWASPAPVDAGERCAPASAADPSSPVYVLMFGYPHDTRGQLPRLHMVGHDLLQMDTFFGALGPKRVWIHGERKPALVDRFGDGLMPPSWRALLRSVDELVAALDSSADRATVYLYFVGHGDRMRSGDRTRGEVYAEPEPGATARGFDGIINSKIFTESVLKPIAERADVNLIVDACRSYYLLARGMKRQQRVIRLPPDIDLESPFKATLPTVGAVLATDGSSATTMEGETFGGLFSHAVRTSAIGAADLDDDGVITYREMNALMAWILLPNGILPTVVTPGGDADRPFIDWRRTSAAPVCMSPKLAGRRTLSTPDGIFATLQIPRSGMAVWLEPGARFHFAGAAAADAVAFTASKGRLSIQRAPHGGHRGVHHEAPFAQPYDEVAARARLAAFEPDPGGWYIGIGAVGHASRLGIRGGEPGVPISPGADLSVRLGKGRHQLVGDLSWSRWDLTTRRGANTTDPAVPVNAHSLGGRLGYGLLLHEGAWDVGADALVGGGVWRGAASAFTLPEAAVRVVAARPFDEAPRWALRTDLLLGAMLLAGGETAPFARVGVGVEYETLLQ